MTTSEIAHFSMNDLCLFQSQEITTASINLQFLDEMASTLTRSPQTPKTQRMRYA